MKKIETYFGYKRYIGHLLGTEFTPRLEITIGRWKNRMGFLWHHLSFKCWGRIERIWGCSEAHIIPKRGLFHKVTAG